MTVFNETHQTFLSHHWGQSHDLCNDGIFPCCCTNPKEIVYGSLILGTRTGSHTWAPCPSNHCKYRREFSGMILLPTCTKDKVEIISIHVPGCVCMKEHNYTLWNGYDPSLITPPLCAVRICVMQFDKLSPNNDINFIYEFDIIGENIMMWIVLLLFIIMQWNSSRYHHDNLIIMLLIMIIITMEIMMDFLKRTFHLVVCSGRCLDLKWTTILYKFIVETKQPWIV